MPFTLTPIPAPISRRRFVIGSLAAAGAAALASSRPLYGQEVRTDVGRFALLSDTHVDANPATVAREVNMADNLRQASREVLALDPKPAGVLINGDLACLKGEPGDYATFVNLLQPIRAAGLPVHLGLGNHDDRERFWQAIPAAHDGERPVEDRQVVVIRAPLANLFLLDSLDKTNSTPGRCGDAQLKWLAAALDAHADKPAVTIVHHNFDNRSQVSGLIDSQPLMELIKSRKHVKLHVFGHTHDWSVKRTPDGLNLVNLPPVAYVFAKGRPSGWVDLQLREGGATMVLHTIDKQHPDNGQQVELQWG